MGSSTMGDPQSPKPPLLGLGRRLRLRLIITVLKPLPFISFNRSVPSYHGLQGAKDTCPFPASTTASTSRSDLPPRLSGSAVRTRFQAARLVSSSSGAWGDWPGRRNTELQRERSTSYSAPSTRSSGFRTCSEVKGRRRRALEEVTSQGLRLPRAGGEGAGGASPGDTRHPPSRSYGRGPGSPQSKSNRAVPCQEFNQTIMGKHRMCIPTFVKLIGLPVFSAVGSPLST